MNDDFRMREHGRRKEAAAHKNHPVRCRRVKGSVFGHSLTKSHLVLDFAVPDGVPELIMLIDPSQIAQAMIPHHFGAALGLREWNSRLIATENRVSTHADVARFALRNVGHPRRNRCSSSGLIHRKPHITSSGNQRLQTRGKLTFVRFDVFGIDSE